MRLHDLHEMRSTFLSQRRDWHVFVKQRRLPHPPSRDEFEALYRRRGRATVDTRAGPVPRGERRPLYYL